MRQEQTDGELSAGDRVIIANAMGGKIYAIDRANATADVKLDNGSTGTFPLKHHAKKDPQSSKGTG